MGLTLIWTFVPLIGMFLVSFAVPMFLDRYLVYAAPGFALLLGVATQNSGLSGRWSSVPGAVLVLGMAVSFTPWATNGLRPSKVVEQCEAWRGDGPVLIHPAYYADTYAWHLDRQLVQEPEELRENLRARGIHMVFGIQDLPTADSSAQYIVLVSVGSTEEGQVRSITEALSKNYRPSGSIEADHNVRVRRFSR
jgi:hypothetical protein